MYKKISNKKNAILFFILIAILFLCFIANSEDILNNANSEIEGNKIENVEEKLEIVNEQAEEIKDETIEKIDNNLNNNTVLINLDDIENLTPAENNSEVLNESLNENVSLNKVIDQENNISTGQENLSITEEQNNALENKTEKQEPAEQIEENKTIEIREIEKSKEQETGGEKNNAEYINLDYITNESSEKKENSTEIKNNEEDIEKKKINFTLYSADNKIEIEGCIDENIEINGIEEIKSIKEGKNWVKEIIVRSSQHINDSLVEYEDIPEISESQKNNVRVYWLNENKEITIREFIDEDNDGLFERISWLIPHLSEQIFEIVINFSTDFSDNLDIEIINAPQGQVENPIEFSFNISYNKLENLNCTLTIGLNNCFINIINQSFIWPYELPNGDYTWLLNCSDLNSSIEKSVLGNLTINENFSISELDKIYILGNKINFSVYSRNNTETKIKLTHPNSTIQDITRINAYPYNLILNESIITKEGLYILNTTSYNFAKPISVVKNFSVAKAELSSNKDKVKVGEEVKLSAAVNSPIEKINSIILDYGDSSSNISYYSIDENTKNIDFYHKYNSKGNYTVKLKIIIASKLFEIEKNGIEVEDSKDSEAPKITLLDPEDDEIIKANEVTFSYKAEDNTKIDNCTFELYNYSKDFGTLDYTEKHTDIKNNEIKEIKLKNFKEGDYSWNVFCCDNSSNCNGDLDYSRDFKIASDSSLSTLSSSTGSSTSSTNNTSQENATHEKKQEINILLSDIENFLVKTESYGLEEKEVLEDLGILEDLEYYKKRLTQIDQDLGNNLKFITDDVQREKRRQELLKEIEEIKEKIPADIKIKDKREYAKNSITQNMEDIVKDYVEAKNINLDKTGIKKLAELNYIVQNYINVLTNIKQVEISYNESKKEITLITKEITLKNDSFNKILEIIPKNLAENASEIIFITENEIIKQDPIFEISADNLENKKLAYYIEKFIDLNETEQIETVLFKEFSIKGISITGFFILDLDKLNNSVYYFYYIAIIVFIIIAIYLIVVCIKKIKINRWKREENVIRIFALIRESKKAIKGNGFNTAKEKYHKIKEVYPLIPEGCKKYLYKEIKNISLSIDKKEIFDLVREYEEAKKQKREEDASRIYTNIQATYKRLPKKYQKIIHKKIFKAPEFL